MIDKEMLEAMRAIMKDELVPVNDRLDNMQADIADLKQGQSVTNARLDKVDARLDKVDARLDSMQTDITNLKQNVDTISERIIKIELVHGKKLDGLYESVVGTGEKFARLDTLENKVEDYGHRIWALEQVVKK